MTNLAPAKYAELNVLGQWLGRTDVIALHYQDQIDQAVGRNRGFRQASTETKTVVVTSLRLWKSVLKELRTETGRALLYLDTARQW